MGWNTMFLLGFFGLFSGATVCWFQGGIVIVARVGFRLVTVRHSWWFYNDNDNANQLDRLIGKFLNYYNLAKDHSFIYKVDSAKLWGHAWGRWNITPRKNPTVLHAFPNPLRDDKLYLCRSPGIFMRFAPNALWLKRKLPRRGPSTMRNEWSCTAKTLG